MNDLAVYKGMTYTSRLRHELKKIKLSLVQPGNTVLALFGPILFKEDIKVPM